MHSTQQTINCRIQGRRKYDRFLSVFENTKSNLMIESYYKEIPALGYPIHHIGLVIFPSPPKSNLTTPKFFPSHLLSPSPWTTSYLGSTRKCKRTSQRIESDHLSHTCRAKDLLRSLDGFALLRDTMRISLEMMVGRFSTL